MRRSSNTIAYREDPSRSSISTRIYQTPELADLAISRVALEAGKETELEHGTVGEAFTAILHLSAVELFELHGTRDLLWSGRCAPGSVNVIARPEALTLSTTHQLEALIFGIPQLSIPRVAPAARTSHGEDHTGQHDAYDAVAHRLGMAFLSAFDASVGPRAHSTVHLARAICYHFAFKYAWMRGTSSNQQRYGLAPWQARTAAGLLEQGNLHVREVAAACQLSPSHFSRLFRVTFQRSPHVWLADRRIDTLKKLLLDVDVSLAEAAAKAGFSDQASMSHAFRRAVGASPGAWRIRQRAGKN